jgi:hypothetical protein
MGDSMQRVAVTVRSTHTSDGGVVLDIRQGQMFSLNPIGSTIFELLKGGRCKSEIVNALTSQFEMSKDIAEADVGEFIESLQRLGLIECQPTNRAKRER